MKMQNDDLKKITEIKQYLLDPPASFKLYDYAIGYVQNAIAILEVYPGAADTVSLLQNLLEQLQNKIIPQQELKSRLKEAGRNISHLTNK